MRLKTFKMAMSILPKFLTLKWNILRTIWHIEVGDGSFFAFFMLFHLVLAFFDQSFPLSMERFILSITRKLLMMLEPHTVLFVAPTGVGKIHLALDLLSRTLIILTMLFFSALPCDTMLHTGV